MKIHRRLLLLIITIPLYFATASEVRASEETDVRAVIARETEGWAKYDAKQVASVFTADAIWQNPFGVRLHGSAKLEIWRVGWICGC